MEEKPSLTAKFPAFPHDPYRIQLEFMNALYDALDHGGIAMLESPTGTGKTLSIICSALQWLVDQREKPKKATATQSVSDDDEPDWMREFEAKKDEVNIVQPKTSKASRARSGLGNLDLRSCDFRSKESRVVAGKKRNEALQLDEDDEFLMEEYESEDEASDVKRKASGSFSSSDEDEPEVEEAALKVFFCSRTHSQLSQFVKELRKTDFSSKVKVVSLGSRKNFCINEDVLRLGNSTRINEKCLELQKSKSKEVSKIKRSDGGRIRRTKASSGCPLLRKQKVQRQFRSEASELGALDIEDLVQLGRVLGTCPYYGTRNMVPAASLVVLPYQSLLQKSSREALGLNLKHSVVIIDEAHNLADSLINMYNSKITVSQLEQIQVHLQLYLDKFCNQLGAGNRRYIQTLMVLTKAFLRLLCDDSHANNASGKDFCDSSLAINDFLFSLDIDNINLVKLQRYIKESKISHKVSVYAAKIFSMQKGPSVDDDGSSSAEGTIVSGFQAFVDFLLSLTNNDAEGRLIVSRKDGYLKYVMLSGEKLFCEIVDQAHAVVLAGGTLQPVEETKERLFPSVSPGQFRFFSCNHIVPPENILPVAVSKGPTGRAFDFSYSARSSAEMMEELGRLVYNLAGIVPEGIVIFFSSFEYKAKVCDAWKASGVFSRIEKKKPVFREPRSNADVENVLKQYKEAITCTSSGSGEEPCQNGAVLLAVVGGKMSEGINFNDGMGRCVVMVGLPYPSPSDLELLERIKHIEGLREQNNPGSKTLLGKESETTVQSGFDVLRSCKKKGREYYENLCMKAVNQSIGRAIRHIGDYAAILLVDSRYASNQSKGAYPQPTSKLPQWIKNRLVSAPENYGEVHRLLSKVIGLHRVIQPVQESKAVIFVLDLVQDCSETDMDFKEQESEEDNAQQVVITRDDKETCSNSSSSHCRQPLFNNYALASCILASMTSILLGYDVGVMSGAALFIKDDLKISSTQEEILIGALNFCSLIGSLASGKTSDWIGRRYTIVLASVTFLIGALLMGLAPSFLYLMAGRVVAGIGVGYSLMIAPVYNAEISPAMSRGFLSSLPELFINVGILLGYISNYLFAGLPQNRSWRLMLGIAAFPALAVAIGVLAMPESPRWLAMRGRDEEAKRVLLKTSNNADEAELRLAEITKTANSPSANSSPRHQRPVWKELLCPSPSVRRILIAAVGINFFMQASGNDAVVYYSPEVFKAAGIKKKKRLVGVTVLMGLTKTFCVFVSAGLLDRFGRRPLLLLGSAGISVSLALLGLGSKILENSEAKPRWAVVMSVVAVCADVSFFSIGLGPINWMYSSEIFPTRLRAQGTSVAISVNRVVSGVVSMTFLSVSKAISFGGTFWLYAAVSAVGVAFTYVFLPETKGKTLEEMGVLFEGAAASSNRRQGGGGE
ncbi:hypothetical protein H6P81_000309 [Aristolochia fimbriata]|uniref:DNA helicase n=1 Tax=Aristolochia fimbriata TaxID=158543 RepID=A0AAV7F6R7_ARIFI|nr:hypothetical protein H6P81_000309 [Aristolochia fimbriata]